jgi:MraZ protein
LFTEESFRQLGERLAAGSPTAQQVRAFSRLFYARAQRVELDGQGRMRLPADLHELAALDREVMVIGVRDHLELWSVSRWEAYIAEKSGHYDHLAEEAFDKE